MPKSDETTGFDYEMERITHAFRELLRAANMEEQPEASFDSDGLAAMVAARSCSVVQMFEMCVKLWLATEGAKYGLSPRGGPTPNQQSPLSFHAVTEDELPGFLRQLLEKGSRPDASNDTP